MSHDKWDDDKIDNLLSSVPKIHDQRSKSEVLQRLKEDGLFDEEPLPIKPIKKKNHWIPVWVSLAAVLLLAILIPPFMNQMTFTTDTKEESATTESEKADMSSFSVPEERTKSENEVNEEMAMVANKTDLRTALYPEEIAGSTVFKLGLASDAADSIPISVLIPNETIQADFGNISPTVVELYNKYAPLFNESAIGFNEYHPYVGVISEQDNQVIHTLPTTQTYDIASASMATYAASLIDTFSDGYEEVAFLKENGSAFEFSQAGEPSLPMTLNSENTQYNYFRSTQSDGSEYLVPNFRVSYTTVEEAILAMKEETNDIYQSVILPDVDFNVTVDNSIVTVAFTEQLNLLDFDQIKAMQMIEGILLTAASFDLPVQFENIEQTEWQGFNFETKLPIPVGANEIPYYSVFQ